MKVTPHPGFVAHVTARRGARDFAAPLPPLDAASVWAAVQSRTVGSERNHVLANIKHDPHVQKALAVLKAGALPEPFDPRTVAVAERIILRHYQAEPKHTLVRVIAEERGLAEMVAIKLDSAAIAVPYNRQSIVFDSEEPEPHDVGWDVARALVCRADDASYAAAREVAAAWRKEHKPRARVIADFLFPSEVAWANEDLDALMPLAASDPHQLYRMFPLLAVLTDEARASALIDAVATAYAYQLQTIMRSWACEIVVSLEPDAALRTLTKLLEKGGRGANKSDVVVLGQAIAALEGEEAAAELAGLLLHPAIGPTAVDYFRRFPDLATGALGKIAQGTSKAADAARSILAAQGAKDDSPLAEGDEIPAVLRDTPWRKRKKTKAVALGAPALPATRIEWKSEEEKAHAAAGKGSYYADRNPTEMSGEVLELWERQEPRHRTCDLWFRWGAARAEYRVPADRSLREWNENPTSQTMLGPLRMLAVHGEAALPGLFARDPFSPQYWNGEVLLDTQLHVIGPASARVAAATLLRRKAWKRKAQDWITAHADVVAQALLPTALGPDGKERKEAEHGVRWAARTHKDAVLVAAKSLGADAERATRELIERDPLTDLEVKGKLPPFVQPGMLPALKTRGGKRLPESAVAALLEILRSTTVDDPYAGLESIRDALDPASLGDFVWALVQAWILAGAKGTYEWIPLSLAFVGDDACARRLAPYVRDWARKDRKKAKTCVDVLAAMGTPAALLHLSYVADKSRFEDAKAHAKETLERVAAQQGLTTEELADRTVPDLELGKDGTTQLDFGPRAFTVTFDEGLRPVLQTADGTRLPAFPRGTKTDDAAKVKAASARFKGLKADAETVAQTLLRRFERAMNTGRTWKASDFREHVVGHPLVTHLAKRLVWSSNGVPFRVADDGTLADANDAEHALPDDAFVTLPHPLALGKDTVQTWSRITSDYAVVQPFEQLGRATYALDAAEATGSKLPRYVGKKSKPGPLMGSLDARGWQKWPDETSLSYCGKKVRTKTGGEAQVSMSFTPGIDLQDVANAPEQEITAVGLSGATSWADLDPVDLSELIRDLEFVAH